MAPMAPMHALLHEHLLADWRTRILASADTERMVRVLAALDQSFGFADVQLPPKIPRLARSAGLRVAEVRFPRQ